MAPLEDSTRRLLAAGFGLLAAALIAGAFYSAFQRDPAHPRPPREAPAPVAQAEQPAPQPAAALAPPFALERLQGGRLSLDALRGKVVVIDFWATWCPPCRAEMPWLVEMAKRLEPRGVVFVAISEDDPPGQVPLVTEFAREVPGLERFAVLGDPEIEATYGVTSLPTLFVVDRQGRILRRFVGATDEETVVSYVASVAAQ